MFRNTLLIILLVVISLTSGIFFHQFLNPDKVISIHPVFEFKLPDLAGKQRYISEWQDKIRIINFWATWCPPCLKEIPEFIKLQNELNDKDIQFIGIVLEDKPVIEEYFKSHPINYPILIAGDEGIALSQKLGNIYNAVPFTLIINQYEQIIHRQPGEFKREKILKLITPLIKNKQ